MRHARAGPAADMPHAKLHSSPLLHLDSQDSGKHGSPRIGAVLAAEQGGQASPRPATRLRGSIATGSVILAWWAPWLAGMRLELPWVRS